MTSTAEDDEARAAAGHGHDSRAGYDVGRLLAFSDGVFAVAITLLVFGIPVPNVPHDRVVAELLHLAPNLIGFALSFVLVGSQWILHHRLLRSLTFCDSTTLWINLLLLMGICLVPFATSLLVNYGSVPAGAIPYAGLQAGIAIVFQGLRHYLRRHGVDAETRFAMPWLQILAFLVSIPVALWRVDLAYALWIAGLIVSRRGPVPNLLGRIPRWPRSRS